MPTPHHKHLPPNWAARAQSYHQALRSDHSVMGGADTYGRPSGISYDLHPGFELGVTLKGEQTGAFSDFSLSMGSGDVWLVCAWELHGWLHTPTHTEVLWLLFLPEFLGEETLLGIPWWVLFAAPPDRRPRVTSARAREQVLSIASDLRQELEERETGWRDAVRLHTLRLLLTLRRDWDPPQTAAAGQSAASNHLLRITPALKALHTSPRGRLTLPEAASLCDLSPSRFAVVFRRCMAMSFGRFAQQARMAHVVQQLMATDRSIEDIALDMGFTDDSHLHRLFLKHYGVTPTVYRNNRT
jgi:AraC-like DNA-binding protein